MSGSTVLQNIPQTIAIVANLVSVLALFLLTVTYSYHIVSAMHTAAHTGDWTHQGVNAAWAPVRGATSAGMNAAPGVLSILASFVLFVASTGNGLGDTAAGKIANMLTAPKPAAVVPPDIQTVVDNALYSLVCAHVLDNFREPPGNRTGGGGASGQFRKPGIFQRDGGRQLRPERLRRLHASSGDRADDGP